MRHSDAHLTRRRNAAIVLFALVLLLALAACSAGAGSASIAKPAPEQVTGGRSLANGDAAAANKGGQAGPSSAPDAADIAAERQVVKTGEVTVEVPNVASALASVRTLALQLGGYVGGSQAGTLEDSATLTLRVPSARFDDLLTGLHQLDGKVKLEATREEDVTASIVDLTARIANLEASEAQYRALVAKAQKIEDILNVQSRLDDVRGQIEQLKGQLKSVSGQADLATLTVTLQPQDRPIQQASSGWDPGATASQALAALLDIGQGLASVVIWFAIVWLPVLLVLAIIGLIVLRGLLELRRRMPVPVAASTPNDPPMA